MTQLASPLRSKITVRFWAPLWDGFVKRADDALLRRDLFFSNALRIELPRLRDELPEVNSPAARRYIESSLQKLFAAAPGARQVSLALEPETARELDEICKGKNIPRETLLNRLMLLLGDTGDILQTASFQMWLGDNSEFADGNCGRKWGELIAAAEANTAGKPFLNIFTPLGRINDVINDPLGRFRALLMLNYESHTGGRGDLDRWDYTPFGFAIDDDHLDGLNCYLPDFAIPNLQSRERVPRGEKRRSNQSFADLAKVSVTSKGEK
jgi:hypothetical protein